jgi:hypothetical protein
VSLARPSQILEMFLRGRGNEPRKHVSLAT